MGGRRDHDVVQRGADVVLRLDAISQCEHHRARRHGFHRHRTCAAAGNARLGHHAAAAITLPSVDPVVAQILYTVPVQMLAYYTAVAKGTDVDQPRNLAKSVTVE